MFVSGKMYSVRYIKIFPSNYLFDQSVTDNVFKIRDGKDSLVLGFGICAVSLKWIILMQII